MPVEPVSVQRGRPIFNYLTHAMRVLSPEVEHEVKSIAVMTKKGLKDFKTMAEQDQTTFTKAVATEFPYGKRLVGIILDLTLNHKTWNQNPYLYA